MSTTFNDKVAVVTGGARGIGRATAIALTDQGFKVAIGDIDAAELAATAVQIGAIGIELDVRDEDSWDHFLGAVENEMGPIDVLVNNAGIMPTGRLNEESNDATRRMLEINLLGVIIGSKLAVRRMLPRGSGHVINIASMAGEVPTPGLATYCATKAAVLAFTHSARLEHRGTGVEFSAVAPSFVKTELTAGTSGVRGMRNADPKEIADAVVGLVRRPRPVVRRTRAMGALVGIQALLPRSANEAIARRLGADDLFLGGVDASVRAAYEDRAASI